MRGLAGFRPWFWQRLSAVYLAGFVLFVAGRLIWFPVTDYGQWHDWLASPLMWMATALFFIALLMHAWVGARDVVLDYIKPDGLRLMMLVGLGGFLLALGLWAARALMMVVMR